MPEKEEPFANPAPPPGHSQRHLDVEATPSRLTNADFRKLLMTPRAGAGTAAPSVAPSAPAGAAPAAAGAHQGGATGKLDKAEERRRRKSYYAKLKRAEDDIMAELAKKYRDRAKERRDGDEDTATGAGAPGQEGQQAEDPAVTAGAYRAVAPDLKSGFDAAERRRQQIQESKFLGGDMEHTHLVKGLDYALLQKVRSEIAAMEMGQEQEMEALADGGAPAAGSAAAAAAAERRHRDDAQRDDELMQFKTKLAKNVYRVLFRDRAPLRNDLFLPGRTAYRIDLDDEYVDFDIPTTVVRSKADCPQVEAATTLTTNDIVINKLTQILSYLRQGRHGRRLKRKDRTRGGGGDDRRGGEGERRPAGAGAEDIYADAGDYVAGAARRTGDRGVDGERESRPRSYFDQPAAAAAAEEETERRRPSARGDRERERDRDRGGDDAADRLLQQSEAQAAHAARDQEKFEREKARESNWLNVDASASAAKKNPKELGTALSGYAECYPGLEEMADAIDDSDDEADYSKMDNGNKKGPIGRWDFDNQEDYSNYMNQKEALPKAAFQYGVKMADGRKTRRLNKEKNERAELDREWQQISAIIAKRKATGAGSEKKRSRPA